VDAVRGCACALLVEVVEVEAVEEGLRDRIAGDE